MADDGMTQREGGSMGEERDERSASEASDLERRQAALRALAQSQQQAPIASAAPKHPTPKPAQQPARQPARPATAPSAYAAGVMGAPHAGSRRRVVAIVAAVVVVAVVAAFGAIHFIGARQGVASAPQTVVRINPTAAGLPCITQVAWSPDGKRIAAVGDTEGCNSSTGGAQSDAVFLFDAQTGKTLAQLRPDPPIYATHGVQQVIGATANQEYTSLFFENLAWTADSKSLLLPFNLFAPSQPGNNFSQVFGLLRLGVSQPSLDAAWLEPTSGIQGNTTLRFDLESDAVAVVPEPAAATAYRWSGADTLSPVSATADTPIGNPIGGESFSIWQPGELLYGSSQPAPNAQPVAVPQDIEWASAFLVISPDGRYCYLSVPSFGSLVPPSTTQVIPQEGTIAPRDAALRALARQMTAAANPSLNTQLLIAWRPDGKLMAAVSDARRGNNGQAPTTISVALYDTASGKLVKTLTPNFAGVQILDNENLALAWSPDGTRLLLLDDVRGLLTIWGPGALPA